MIVVIALHDEAIGLPNHEEKAWAMEFVEGETFAGWRKGCLLADGTKIALYQKPGLHGEAYFDKNKNYSLDCQVSFNS